MVTNMQEKVFRVVDMILLQFVMTIMKKPSNCADDYVLREQPSQIFAIYFNVNS